MSGPTPPGDQPDRPAAVPQGEPSDSADVWAPPSPDRTAPHAPDDETTSPADQAVPWKQLNPRMLLVKPITAGFRALPAIIVPLFVGAQTGNPTWIILGAAAFVYVACIDWLMTRYRVGPEHVQLKTGLISRNVLSIPRSRIRSVDVRATVLHRMLGLAVLRIGTGQRSAGLSGSSFELDAIAAKDVPELREVLLAGVRAAADDSDAPGTAADDSSIGPAAERAAGQRTPGPELAHWKRAWTWYAPFGFTGVFIILAGLGLFFQSGAVYERLLDTQFIAESADAVRDVNPFLAGTAAIAGLVIVASLIAMAQYFLTYSGFTLHDDGRTLRVHHGLLNTRESTLDRRRLRGVTIENPLLLRAAGGARARAIMTGLRDASGESSLILPDAPQRRAREVFGAVLHDGELARTPLRRHGPKALQRRLFRALILPLLAVAGMLVVENTIAGLPRWAWVLAAVIVALSVFLGIDRYRALGHATPAGWLICQSGSLTRSRDCVAAQGIIGWTITQTFFQRRAGLATVTAATPAGRGAYSVEDMPAVDAWDLIESVTPGMSRTFQRDSQFPRSPERCAGSN